MNAIIIIFIVLSSILALSTLAITGMEIYVERKNLKQEQNGAEATSDVEDTDTDDDMQEIK